MARSVGAARVTSDHPPGVIPRDPCAGDAARMGEAVPARRHRGAPERAGPPARGERRAGGPRGQPLAVAPRRARAPAGARLRALRRVGDRDLDARDGPEHQPLRRHHGPDRAQLRGAEGGGGQARRQDHGRDRLSGAGARDRPQTRRRAGPGDPGRRGRRDPPGPRPLRGVGPLLRAVGRGEPARARDGRSAADHRQVEPAHARRRRRVPRSQPGRRPRQGPAARARLRHASPMPSRPPSTGASRC